MTTYFVATYACETWTLRKTETKRISINVHAYEVTLHVSLCHIFIWTLLSAMNK